MARLALSFLMIGFLLTGCNSKEGRVQTHKVSGKVTYNGSPVASATVTFSPQESGTPAAMGITDGQGVYTLTTYDSGDGAAAGLYKVMVYKMNEAASSTPSMPAHDPTGAGPSGAPAHSGPRGGQQKSASSLLPEKYMKADTTPLTKNVVGGVNEINIEL
ncbi:carboxypeptidase-like regulatory domain-containing protein [Pirellulaceae bacterium SH449]